MWRTDTLMCMIMKVTEAVSWCCRVSEWTKYQINCLMLSFNSVNSLTSSPPSQLYAESRSEQRRFSTVSLQTTGWVWVNWSTTAALEGSSWSRFTSWWESAESLEGQITLLYLFIGHRLGGSNDYGPGPQILKSECNPDLKQLKQEQK